MVTNLSLTVRPLNPDNEVEVQNLVALFSRAPQHDNLSDSTKVPRYWKTACGRRFTSIIALHEGEIIAHCGFSTDKNSPGLAVLTHPLVDIDAGAIVAELAREFESVITSQMLRKRLTTVMTFRSAQSSPALEQFMQELSFLPVAQLPDSIPNSVTENGRSIEIWARVFERGTCSLQFVPMELRGVVASAYRALGIRSVTRLTSQDDSLGLPADELAVEPLPVSRTGKILILVTPSLLLNANGNRWMPLKLERTLRRWPQAVLAVKLHDQSCTEMVQLLQSEGLSYLGILPAVYGRDSLLFSRSGHPSKKTKSTATGLRI